MERAVYCYCWLPGRPNSHPVHTLKHIGMVEDMDKNHATMLCWSMMGSAAISLPFLERQIYGELPPQLRFHGYLTDKEFNEECLKRGILPYAVVYQAQGWEFPVILNEDETEIKEINLIRSDEEPQWYGLREFADGTHHTLFNKKFEDYFPDGLVNSDGEPVRDLWNECTTRDMYGNPTHSHWVEVEGLAQTCHGMCRNNPVWRNYLKKIIEIQIDAGARAIQLDESETPICSIGFGGCFCKDCMKQFREYLKRRKAQGTLPEDMQDLDLDAFHYGDYLKERHIRWAENVMSIPFSAVYWEFIVETQNKHFQEIIGYVKEYGRRKTGTDIKVSGNFTNMHLLYYPSLPYVDCCITELRRTIFRRHNWYRLATGYTGEKPLILAESPYDGFIPKFVELIHRGLADDYYRVFIMEAAIHGCNMAFPYGAWMGNKHYDSFHAPFKTGTEVQDYLYHNADLFGRKSGANVLVLYSYPSYMMRDWQCGQGENLDYDNSEDLFSYRVTYDERASRMPFFEVTQKMTDGQIPYDVLVLGDGALAPDSFCAGNLEGYDMVIVPDCCRLTKNQADILLAYSKSHPVCVYGDYASNIADAAQALKRTAAVFADDIKEAELSCSSFIRSVSGIYKEKRQYFCDNSNIYVQPVVTNEGKVFHFLNYAYDLEQSKTVPQTFILDMKLPDVKGVSTFTLSGSPLSYEILPSAQEGCMRIKINNAPCYGAILAKI